MSRHASGLGSLDKKTERELSYKAIDKLDELNKSNDIIGTYIFTILEQQSMLILFPFSNIDIWGFMTKQGDTCFSCINTSLSLEQQVFVAAHELYHIWYKGREELITVQESFGNEEVPLPLNEQRANRFAAELLVARTLLEREIRVLKIDRSSIGAKEVIRLANSFTVPYRMMVRRLYEIDAIPFRDAMKLLSTSPVEIDQWRRRLGYPSYEATGRIRMGNLPELAIEAFERDLINKDRLDYLLGLADLDSEQVGIPSETKQLHLHLGDVPGKEDGGS
ncbi:MAG: ImmA/IrrE family metallo-endopeptidase [Sphaerochaetaceae bacterium]|jgi:Zn-dependent peptidase ImmA (M78 family)|nr:ImmA/IrrE family metallo-endopeptidase [Sphaerochaetaceae bacterium]